MSTELPDPIADYFAAANRHDIEAALAPFSANATVIDEGRQRGGFAAIREWIEETMRKYRPTATILGVSPADDNDEITVVTARVSGTFPGSPIDIRYSFTLKHEKIARLEIR